MNYEEISAYVCSCSVSPLAPAFRRANCSVKSWCFFSVLGILLSHVLLLLFNKSITLSLFSLLQGLPETLSHKCVIKRCQMFWVTTIHGCYLIQVVFCGNKSSETIDRRDFLILLCLGADHVSIFQPEIP